MTEGGGENSEPELKWLDIEDAFAKVYQKGESAEEFIKRGRETEAIRIYVRYKPYNLMIGRALFPDTERGINFWIEITAPPEREDIKHDLYAATVFDDRLFVERGDILENAGRPMTDEILKMIREGTVVHPSEFTDEETD